MTTYMRDLLASYTKAVEDIMLASERKDDVPGFVEAQRRRSAAHASLVDAIEKLEG